MARQAEERAELAEAQAAQQHAAALDEQHIAAREEAEARELAEAQAAQQHAAAEEQRIAARAEAEAREARECEARERNPEQALARCTLRCVQVHRRHHHHCHHCHQYRDHQFAPKLTCVLIALTLLGQFRSGLEHGFT